MSSILTNNSAMVALQTLKNINSSMTQTQQEISTGKTVATAKDNAAVWAISKTMESDVKGFEAIEDSLSLGQSTVAVARNATESVTDLLVEIKGKITAAQEDNVDREAIQSDIKALRDQISSVTGAAQFNGLNMVSGDEKVEILASLDRSSNGAVTPSKISVDRQDLTQRSAALSATGADITVGTLTDTGTDNQVSASGTSTTLTTDASGRSDGDAMTVTIAGVDVTANFATGDDADAIATKFETAFATAKSSNAAALGGISLSVDGDEITLTQDNLADEVAIETGTNSGALGVSSDTAIAASGDKIVFGDTAEKNDGFQITVGDNEFTYIAKAGDTGEDIATNLAGQINAAEIDGVTATFDGGTLRVGDDAGGSNALSLSQKADSITGGGLSDLATLSVSTKDDAAAALTAIEGMITKSIDAAAAFGSAQGRIETQSNFISKLTDSLKSGIGTLVDANMEETSAKLQALQVQQQLGVQALSIANQSPQSILSLFR